MASPAPSQLGSTKSIRSASVQSLANSPRSGPARKLLNALNTVGKEEDQIGESKRVLGVLLGTDSEIGLLALVEQEFLGLLHGIEGAFQDETDSAKTENSLRETTALLSTLLNILRNSPLGGLAVINSSCNSTVPPTLVELIEQKQKQTQSLFKDRQRAREGAEVVRDILMGGNKD